MTPTPIRRVLELVIAALEERNAPYHVTGGLASSFYGEPRLTQDVDVVVRLASADAEWIARALSPEFLVDERRAARAADVGGMFQALHLELVVKADFHVGEAVPGELSRSRTVEIFDGLEVRIVSKEDAILSKLLWARRGSAKSRNDVLGMLLDPQPVDERLLDDLAPELDCAALLREIRCEARVDRLDPGGKSR